MKQIQRFLILYFLFTANGVFCQNSSTLSLDGQWKLIYGLNDSTSPQTPEKLINSNMEKITAAVPGNVELALLAAGKISNPETGNHIYDLRKFEAYQWWYSKTFKTPVFKKDERVEIIFEGLDCFGTIWINNHLIGKTENMLIDHHFDITDLLNQGVINTIAIRIDPAVAEGQKGINGVIGTRMDLGAEAVNVRKAPHMYGWDIMPRLISAGLWRSVHLEVIKPTRLKQVYWMTNSVDLLKKRAQLLLDWDFVSGLPTIDGLTMEVILSQDSKICYENSYPLFTIGTIKQSKIKLKFSQNILK